MMADLSTRYCRGCRQTRSAKLFPFRSNENRGAQCQMCVDRHIVRRAERRRRRSTIVEPGNQVCIFNSQNFQLSLPKIAC
jgi:hypothetical protein